MRRIFYLFLMIFVPFFAVTGAVQQTITNDVLLAPVGVVAQMLTKLQIEDAMATVLERISVMGLRVQKTASSGLTGGSLIQELFATGFPVTKTLVATVNHIYEDPKKTKVFHRGGWKDITFLGRVHTIDLSFFTFKDADFGTEFHFVSAQSIFQSLQAVGPTTPLQNVLVGMKCSKGNEVKIVIGTLKWYNLLEKTFTFTVSRASDGCSGAPVVMLSGAVMGIFPSNVNSDRGAIGFALDIEVVADAAEAVITRIQNKR